MSQGTSNQNQINPPPGVAERLPRLIDVAAYRTFWQAADDIERRFLDLAFRLEMGSDGWTVDGYTMTELHDLMQYTPTGDKRDETGTVIRRGSRARLHEIIEKYRALGVIQTHPPRGHRRRFWFSFVLAATSQKISQLQYNVSQTLNSGEPDTHSDEKTQCEPDTHSKVGNVSQTLFKSESDTLPMRAGHTLADTDLEEEDSINIDPSTKDHLLLAHERVMQRLKDLEVGGPAFQKAKTMLPEDLETIIENTLLGFEKGQVTSMNGWIASSILSGIVDRKFIQERERESQAAAAQAEQQRQLEALADTSNPEADVPTETVIEIIQNSREAALAEERRIRESMNTSLISQLRPNKRTTYQDCWVAALDTLRIRLHSAEYNNAFAGSYLVGVLDEEQRYLVVEARDYYVKERAAGPYAIEAHQALRNISGEILGLKFVSPESKTALVESAA